jgi:hypothetical protein
MPPHAGLASQQWGQKRTAAKGVASLAELGADALSPDQAQQLVGQLLRVRFLLCSQHATFFVQDSPALRDSCTAEDAC